MSEQKVPLYSGEVGDKQEEFIDALWSYYRYKTSNERNGHVQWDTIEYSGQFTKGVAHDVWKKFRKDNLDGYL